MRAVNYVHGKQEEKKTEQQKKRSVLQGTPFESCVAGSRQLFFFVGLLAFSFSITFFHFFQYKAHRDAQLSFTNAYTHAVLQKERKRDKSRASVFLILSPYHHYIYKYNLSFLLCLPPSLPPSFPPLLALAQRLLQLFLLLDICLFQCHHICFILSF